MNDIVERIKDAENATHALFNHIFQDAREEIERLRAKIAEMEISKHDVSEAHNVAKRRLSALADENITLQARIAEMEQQEPVWFIDERGEPKRYHKSKADYCKYGGLDLLYARPGAKGE